MSTKTIKLIGITKKYRRKEVLSGIDYTFYPGKCYLIVGANGAGKTTLLKIMMRLIYPTKGKVIDNNPIIGYVPEKIFVPARISVSEFLHSIVKIKNGKDLDLYFLLKFFELQTEKEKKMHLLSKGMLRKVLIIQAVIGDPDVLIFDEALNGLDALMRLKLLELIKKAKEKKKTVIITSHHPSFYEEVIDERLVIKDGQIG